MTVDQDFGGEPHQSAQQFQQSQPPASPIDRSGVIVPMLISGIFNILAAIGWAFTCVGIPISIALFVLAIFEFLTFSGGQTMPREQIGSRAGVLGVLEICTIAVGNIGSFVCGIIVIANRGKL